MGEFDSITAGELMDSQFKTQSMIIDGMLPVGAYILAGTPKIGKSFFVTQLCWCISEGRPFMGLNTKQGSVLYFALEDGGYRLQERLGKMFGADWNGDNLHLLFRVEHRGKRLLENLQPNLNKYKDLRLIVIDTFQCVRENPGSSYNYGEDYEEIKPFTQFARKNGLAIILVHHTRKNSKDPDPLHSISGTNGLVGAADGAFVLYRARDGIRLEQSGRDIANWRYHLSKSSENGCWQILEQEEVQMGEPKDPLVDIIDQTFEKYWIGTSSELLEMVREIDPNTTYKPNTLTRRLNTLTGQLQDEKGITYFNQRCAERRILKLSKESVMSEEEKIEMNTCFKELEKASQSKERIIWLG